MRLGESLVQSGHITESQLEKALNAQLIFGGHLGTCLIELGYVDEQTLGKLLSQVFAVEYAHPGLLDDIQPQTLAALTQASVEKHMAIPFDLTKKRTLRVAMVNPGHVPSLDEMFFVSGLRIEAWVSPEVRVFQAMERYYQVQRRVRYISLARRLDEQKPAARAVATPTAMLAAVATQTAGAGCAAVALPKLVPIAPAAASGDWDEGAESPVAHAPGKHEPAPVAGDLEGRLTRTAEELCRAEDVGVAIKALLDHVALDAARCVFFGLKENEAFVRDVRGFTLDALTAHKVRFDVTTEPLLTLLSGEAFYRGPVPDQPKYQGFFGALRTSMPREILLLPLHRHDRIAGLLYADGGTQGVIDGETESFLRAARKFTLSLDLIETRQRVRSA